jgi:branched-chain amino acid transport system permease protein
VVWYDIPTLMQFVITGLAVGCVYSLVALGFTVIFNASGILNFSQGSFVMLGGMLTYVFYRTLAWPLGFAAVGALLVVALIGLIAERLVIAPLWRRHSPLYTIIIATFGIHIVLENAALIGIDSNAVGLPPFVDIGPLAVLGVSVNAQMLWIVVVGATIMLALNFFFRRTLTGRAMRACAVNPVAAQLMGIEVQRMIRYSFVISAVLGAVAGILITPAQFTQFNVGIPFGLKGFTAAMVGGIGNITGAIVGGLLLGLLESLGVAFISSRFKDAISFGLLIVILLLRPRGLFGSLVEEEEV